jgi:hypothetical protein
MVALHAGAVCEQRWHADCAGRGAERGPCSVGGSATEGSRVVLIEQGRSRLRTVGAPERGPEPAHAIALDESAVEAGGLDAGPRPEGPMMH